MNILSQILILWMCWFQDQQGIKLQISHFRLPDTLNKWGTKFLKKAILGLEVTLNWKHKAMEKDTQ